jgi:hypothetical protein
MRLAAQGARAGACGAERQRRRAWTVAPFALILLLLVSASGRAQGTTHAVGGSRIAAGACGSVAPWQTPPGEPQGTALAPLFRPGPAHRQARRIGAQSRRLQHARARSLIRSGAGWCCRLQGPLLISSCTRRVSHGPGTQPYVPACPPPRDHSHDRPPTASRPPRSSPQRPPATTSNAPPAAAAAAASARRALSSRQRRTRSST